MHSISSKMLNDINITTNYIEHYELKVTFLNLLEFNDYSNFIGNA